MSNSLNIDVQHTYTLEWHSNDTQMRMSGEHAYMVTNAGLQSAETVISKPSVYTNEYVEYKFY